MSARAPSLPVAPWPWRSWTELPSSTGRRASSPAEDRARASFPPRREPPSSRGARPGREGASCSFRVPCACLPRRKPAASRRAPRTANGPALRAAPWAAPPSAHRGGAFRGSAASASAPGSGADASGRPRRASMERPCRPWFPRARAYWEIGQVSAIARSACARSAQSRRRSPGFRVDTMWHGRWIGNVREVTTMRRTMSLVLGTALVAGCSSGSSGGGEPGGTTGGVGSDGGSTVTDAGTSPHDAAPVDRRGARDERNQGGRQRGANRSHASTIAQAGRLVRGLTNCADARRRRTGR
jgi:hypothetical protein